MKVEKDKHSVWIGLIIESESIFPSLSTILGRFLFENISISTMVPSAVISQIWCFWKLFIANRTWHFETIALKMDSMTLLYQKLSKGVWGRPINGPVIESLPMRSNVIDTDRFSLKRLIAYFARKWSFVGVSPYMSSHMIEIEWFVFTDCIERAFDRTVRILSFQISPFFRWTNYQIIFIRGVRTVWFNKLGWIPKSLSHHVHLH